METKKQNVITVKLDVDCAKIKTKLKTKAKKLGFKKSDNTGNVNALLCQTIKELVK